MHPTFPRCPRRGIFPFAALLALGAASVTAGPISFDGTTTYTQDFAGLSMHDGDEHCRLGWFDDDGGDRHSTGGGGVQAMSMSTGQNYGTARLRASKWVAWRHWERATGGGFYDELHSTPSRQRRGPGVRFAGFRFGNGGFFGSGPAAIAPVQTINNLSIAYDAVMNRNPNGATGAVNTFALGYAVSSTAVVSATQASAGCSGYLCRCGRVVEFDHVRLLDTFDLVPARLARR